MIDPTSQFRLRTEITNRIQDDRGVLGQLRDELKVLHSDVHRIQSRVTTSISVVATDGGNNRIEYDPFLVQIVRVVDSSNNEYCLEAITPSTSITELSENQFHGNGTPRTPLGKMMAFLGVRDLRELSYMIQGQDGVRPTSPGWIQTYRELVEWAILFTILREKEFGSDTLIVFDGLLRSKVFARDYFGRYIQGLVDAIDEHYRRSRRKIYVAGVAKHSKVLTRYRLAMSLDGILATDYPAYVEIPRSLERNAYNFPNYVRTDASEEADEQMNAYTGGKMFFVKFGNRPSDPIWPVDILLPQKEQAALIIGSLLADAQNGFPIPFYPLCLQRAHENAALVDFDFEILQDFIFDAIRGLLGTESQVLEVARLRDEDPAALRYA